MPPPLRSFAGKAAFITGGSSGIGLGIARACALAGMRVVLTYRTSAHFRSAMKCFEPSAEVHGIELDVTDRDAMRGAADEAESRVGSIHLLCSNAGIGIRARIVDASFDDWDYAMAVNVGGTINAIQVLLPRMLAHGESAHVLATSSMGGLFHGGTAGIYTTTKFALVGMMEALRTDLMSTNVGVSVFCPGLVQSNLSRWQRNLPERFSKARVESPRVMTTSISEAGMDPLECGRKVLAGVQNNDMYILTHSEYEQGVVDRHEALLACFSRQKAQAPQSRIQAESAVLRGRAYMREKERK